MKPLHVKIQRKQRPLTKRKTKKCHKNEPPTSKLIKGIIEQIPNKKGKGLPSKNIKLKKEKNSPTSYQTIDKKRKQRRLVMKGGMYKTDKRL